MMKGVFFMKLKIVMDSGKEYITDKYESKEDFLKKVMPTQANMLSFHHIDKEDTIMISSAHVSSIESVK